MQIEFGDLAAEINIARHHFIQEALKPLGEDILNPAKTQPRVDFTGTPMALMSACERPRLKTKPCLR